MDKHCDRLLPRSDNTSMGVGTIELSSYANAIKIQKPFTYILVENLGNGSDRNLASTGLNRCVLLVASYVTVAT